MEDDNHVFWEFEGDFCFLFLQFFLFLECLEKFFDIPRRIVNVDPETTYSTPLAALGNVLLAANSVKGLKVAVEPHRKEFLLVTILNAAAFGRSHSNFILMNNSSKVRTALFDDSSEQLNDIK